MSSGVPHPSDERFRKTSSELDTNLSDEDKVNVYR